MNRGLCTALTAVALTLSVFPGDAVFAAATDAICTFGYNSEIKPRLSLQPGSGTITSDPSTGVADIPTEAGRVAVKEPILFGFGPGSGYPPGVGDLTGERANGTYVVIPTEGDCVSAPVTKARGTGRFTLTG